MEEKIIREYEKRNPPEPTKPRFDSILQPSQVAKPASPPQPQAIRAVIIEKTKIDEFDPAATPQSPWDVPTTVKDDIDDLSKAMEQSRVSTEKPIVTKSPSPPAVDKDYDEITANFIPDAPATDVQIQLYRIFYIIFILENVFGCGTSRSRSDESEGHGCTPRLLPFPGPTRITCSLLGKLFGALRTRL